MAPPRRPSYPRQAACSLVLAVAALGSAQAGVVATLAVTGEPLPGLPEGVEAELMRAPGLGPDGMVPLHVTLRGAGVDASNDTAVFVRLPGASTVQLVAREGVTTAEGETLGQILDARVIRDGLVLFAGTDREPRPRLWLRVADGTLATYARFGGTTEEPDWLTLALDSANQFVTIMDSGLGLLFPSTAANSVLASGTQAPGFAPGETFDWFQSLRVNASGTAVFDAWVGERYGIFASDLGSGDATPRLLVREGDMVGPGDDWELSWIDTFGTALVHDGTLVFGAEAVDRLTQSPRASGLWVLGPSGVEPFLIRGEVLTQAPEYTVVSPYMYEASGGHAALFSQLDSGELLDSILYHDRSGNLVRPLVISGDAVPGETDLRFTFFGLSELAVNPLGQVGFTASLADALDNPTVAVFVTGANGGEPGVALKRGDTLLTASCQLHTITDLGGRGGGGEAGLGGGLSADGETVVWVDLDRNGDGAADSFGVVVAAVDGSTSPAACGGADLLFSDGFE